MKHGQVELESVVKRGENWRERADPSRRSRLLGDASQPQWLDSQRRTPPDRGPARQAVELFVGFLRLLKQRVGHVSRFCGNCARP